MSQELYDLVTVGGGPAGYGAALYAASAGLKVAVVEEDRVGGTCLQRGCVPAKEFLETAATYRCVQGAAEFGIETSPTRIDFGVSQSRKQQVVDRLTKGLAGLMKGRGIDIFDGHGTYKGGGAVEVSGGETLQGSSIILAAGSKPRWIRGFEPDGESILTSDEVLSLTRLPESVLIVGGGVIGCEFASMMSDLGTTVTIVEALPSILPGVDTELTGVLLRSFKKRGIKVKTGVGVSSHRRAGKLVAVELADGSEIEVAQVVVAVGRRPNSDGLLAPGSSVEVDAQGFVKVGPGYETAERSVFAIGDLINTAQLAHVGFAEGIAAVKAILGESAAPVDYTRVPWCIYTHPEIAFAGLTEEQAAEHGVDVVVKKDLLGGNSRARIIGEVDGFVKVVADAKTHQVLGVHLVGPWATELLSPGYLAVNWEATAEEIAQFIQPHPTLSEAFGETVLALTGRSLHVG